MAYLFAAILTYGTLITGIFWCLERFKFRPARQKKIEEVRKQTDGKIDGNILATIAPPNKYVEGIASFFPVLFFVFFVRSFVLEPFQIPSGSMMKTLLVGDFLTVKKYSYGLRNPITNATLIPTGTPQRGEIAVFKYPVNPTDNYIKRVIGVPGDKVVYDWDTQELSIYPACEQDDISCVGNQTTPLNLNYGPITQSNWMYVIDITNNIETFYTVDEWQKVKSENPQNEYVSIRLNMRSETLGDETHTILLDPNHYRYPGARSGKSTWTVPKDKYFMMGDNRDHSADSRYWGFVPEENFVGEANFIWLSFDKQPNEWPTGIRFDRIGFIK